MTTRLRRRMIVIALCVTVAAPGCASARLNHAGVAVAPAREPGQGVDPATLAEYLRTLPLGKTIRVERVDGRSLRGTLLKVTDRSLTFQEKTRIPEPAIEIPFSEILRVTPVTNGGTNVAKTIGIGAAAAAGAVLAVFLILVAAYGD